MVRCPSGIRNRLHAYVNAIARIAAEITGSAICSRLTPADHITTSSLSLFSRFST